MKTLIQSDVPGATLFRRGKVRDVYEAGGDRLVIIASDRLSAFDVVLPTPIPDKGRVLSEISTFWFDRTERVVPNHLVSTNIDDLPAVFREVPELDGRAVLVKRCERIDVECVARGYIAKQLEETTLELYRKAHAYALGRGLILADTKFEFGFYDGKLTLIDEALTPDSSRYWDAASYKPGGSPPSYDKQYVRDFLVQSGWNKEPPAPALPPEVVAGTSQRYRECYGKLTGEEWFG